jgi:TM2 domain-containing membrane protein YozV
MDNKTTKYCRDCGAEINSRAEICPKCGIRQLGNFDGNNRKLTAGLLALLVGGFGVHHFYLKHIGRGILYLLFCWTFIPAIVALIEGIIYLTCSEEEFQRKYA